jgi:hypothetical protein
MIEELVRLKKMQRRRVQFFLIHHSMRRMIQEPGELSITIDFENRRHATHGHARDTPAHAHERLAELVQAIARTVSPERISRLDIDEIGGVSVKKQSAQLAMLAELEI